MKKKMKKKKQLILLNNFHSATAILAGLQSKTLAFVNTVGELISKIESDMNAKIKAIEKKEQPSIPFM